MSREILKNIVRGVAALGLAASGEFITPVAAQNNIQAENEALVRHYGWNLSNGRLPLTVVCVEPRVPVNVEVQDSVSRVTFRTHRYEISVDDANPEGNIAFVSGEPDRPAIMASTRLAPNDVITFRHDGSESMAQPLGEIRFGVDVAFTEIDLVESPLEAEVVNQCNLARYIHGGSAPLR